MNRALVSTVVALVLALGASSPALAAGPTPPPMIARGWMPYLTGAAGLLIGMLYAAVTAWRNGRGSRGRGSAGPTQSQRRSKR